MRQYIVERIKNAKRLRFLSNCYSTNPLEKANDLWELGDSFLFSAEDHGVQRLYYFAKGYEELEKLIAMIKPGKYCFELITKNPDEYVPKGSSVIARLMRLANADCSTVFNGSPVLQYRDDSVGTMACVKDAHEINQLLWKTFQTEVSHLLMDRELAELIQNGQVFIHKDEGERIDTVLQVEVMPKKFYINQVINKAEKSIIHAILLNQLYRYVQNGGKYLYAWVENSNIASMKFHGKYGMVHDGLWNMVYRIER